MFLDVFGLYLLVVGRVAGLLATMPIFSHPMIPARVKGGLAFIIAFIYAPLAKGPQIVGIPTLLYSTYLLKEVVLGVAIGFTARVILSVVRMGGEVMGFLMGFSFVNLLDPTSNQEVSILGEFYHQIAILHFFMLGGPKVVFLSLRDSFRLLPVGLSIYAEPASQLFIELFTTFFRLGIQFAFPVIATLMVTEVSLGLVAKAVPQMNVFQVGFPLKIGVGMTILLLGLPGILDFLDLMIPLLDNYIHHFFRIIQATGS